MGGIKTKITEFTLINGDGEKLVMKQDVEDEELLNIFVLDSTDGENGSFYIEKENVNKIVEALSALSD